MNTGRIVLTVAASAAFITAVAGSKPTSDGPRSAAIASASSAPSLVRILGVDALMKSNPIPRGRLQVEGVVRATSAVDGSLALIDRGEFDHCGVTTCASLVLPVRWTGPMPSIAQVVRIDGQVQEVRGRLVLVARQIQVLAHTARKGQ